MLAFITSLRHPKNVQSMPTMLRLLERTLDTLCAQTDQDFMVLIVCHEIPALSRAYPNIEFLIVDFPAPATDFTHLVANLDMVRLDKGQKYLAGLYHIRDRAPSHVMFFDADDCIAPTLVQTVSEGPSNQSWYVGEGYIYAEGSRWIVHRKDDFNTHCGTCYVFDSRFYRDLPEDKTDISEEWLKNNLGSHRLVHEYLAEKGIVLKKIPYPAVTYIINTGENHSGLNGYALWVSRRGGVVRWIRFLLKIGSFQRLKEEVRERFLLGK